MKQLLFLCLMVPSLVLAQFSQDKLTADLYKELEGEDNVAFSPVSILGAMSMAGFGAQGETREEIFSGLGLPLNTTSGELGSYLNGLSLEGEARLDVANALVLTGGGILGSYQQMVREDFDAEVFSGGLEEINGWVSKKTQGKIPKMLEELSSASACVLLNAVYFKGKWASPFEVEATVKAPFTLGSGQRVGVDMMRQRGDFPFVSNENFSAVALPYEGPLMMVVVLPEKGFVLDREFFKGLPYQFRGDVSKVDLMLPKFTLETSLDLVSSFKNLGMDLPFDLDKADFSLMSQQSLAISQIKHKVFIAVDEKGTEAAAATAIVMMVGSMAVPLVHEFKVDRPFFFVIVELSSNAILFCGKVEDPR
jgi:serine protease inhibitor